MKNFFFLAKCKQIWLLSATLIIIFSTAWTNSIPAVKTYETSVNPNSKGAFISCVSPAQFERPKKILKQLHPNLDLDLNRLSGIIFYHNSSEERALNLGINVIEGISLYYIDSLNFLHHTAYLRKGNYFTIISELNLKTDVVSFNDIHFIQKYLNKSRKLNNYCFFKYSQPPKYGSTQGDLGLMRIVHNMRNGVEAFCEGFGCDRIKDKECQAGDTGGGACFGRYDDAIGWCPWTWAGSRLRNDFSEDFMQKYFDLELYRQFRDHFLSQSIIGRKYIDYYKILGGYFPSADKFNTTLLVKTASLAPHVYKITKLLLDKNAPNDVVITESEKNDFIQLLQLYKDLYDSKDYRLLISDIEKDMSLFAGKTKITLIEYLNKQ